MPTVFFGAKTHGDSFNLHLNEIRSGLGDAIKRGMKTLKNKLEKTIDNVNGKIAVPIMLYMLGVPGFLVILLWLFFFRGK